MMLAHVEVARNTNNVMGEKGRFLLLILGIVFGGFGEISAQIVQSFSLEKLSSRYSYYLTHNETTEIFSINVLSTPDRRKMESVKAKFRSVFPNYALEWSYDEPYYKLFTGKFITEKECWNRFYQIRKKYPNAIIRFDRISPEEFFDD